MANKRKQRLLHPSVLLSGQELQPLALQCKTRGEPASILFFLNASYIMKDSSFAVLPFKHPTYKVQAIRGIEEEPSQFEIPGLEALQQQSDTPAKLVA